MSFPSLKRFSSFPGPLDRLKSFPCLVLTCCLLHSSSPATPSAVLPHDPGSQSECPFSLQIQKTLLIPLCLVFCHHLYEAFHDTPCILSELLFLWAPKVLCLYLSLLCLVDNTIIHLIGSCASELLEELTPLT